MFRTTARRVGMVTAAAVLAEMVTTAAARADDDYGSIGGHFTTASGAPIANATVVLHFGRSSGAERAFTTTDENGAYAFQDLSPADFSVQFVRDAGEGLSEYAPQAKT